MLKTLLLTLVLSTPAFAIPSVGDKSVYLVQTESPEGSSTAFVTMEITGFDSTSQSYMVRTTAEAGGGRQVSESKIGADQMATQAQLEAVLANCAAMGGRLGNVEVPAGSLNACTLASQGAEISMGVVPFGIILSKSTSGTTKTTMALQSYVAAP